MIEWMNDATLSISMYEKAKNNTKDVCIMTPFGYFDLTLHPSVTILNMG
jgi:hypothetical protein